MPYDLDALTDLDTLKESDVEDSSDDFGLDLFIEDEQSALRK